MTRNSKKQKGNNIYREEGIEDEINNNDDDNDNNSENDRNDEITDKNHKNNNNNKKIDSNNGKSNNNNNIINEEVKTTTTSSSLYNGLDTPSIKDSDCKSELTNINKVSSTPRTVDSQGILNLFYLRCIIFHIILLNAYY